MALEDAAKITFRLFVSASQQREIEILRKQIVQDAHEKVEALLDIDAGNHRHDRPIQMTGVQLKLPQQRLLVLQFSREVGNAVIGGDQIVCLRIPKLDIDAVENADQIVRPSAKNSFEAVAEFRAFLDLACVGRADGRNE